MKNFWEITDYRDFLVLYYERRKKQSSVYSYRVMGDQLGVDASFLYKVMKKQCHLSGRVLASIKDILGLSGRAAEYFDLLLGLSKAKTEREKEHIRAMIQNLQDVSRKHLQEKELRVLRNWWVPVVRSYIELEKGEIDPQKIASQISPNISCAQVLEALTLLRETGLVESPATGRLRLTSPHLTVSGAEKAEAVRQFQREVLGLAADSLEACPVEERDVSTLTIAVDEAAFEEIRELLKETRRLIQKRVDETRSPDRVMELSMAFFPVARGRRAKK